MNGLIIDDELKKRLEEAKKKRKGKMFILNEDNLKKWGVK